MRVRPQTVFTLLIAIGLALLIVSTRSWSPTSRLFPLAIAVPALVLTLVQLVLDLRRRPAADGEEPPPIMDMSPDPSIPPEVVMPRALRMFGWLAGLMVGSWLVGFHIAVPAFMLLYYLIQARSSWLVAIVSTGVTSLLLFGLFDYLIHVYFPPSFLSQLLSGS